MKLKPKVKKILLVVIVLLCIAAAAAFYLYRQSKKKTPEELYIENKLSVANSYAWQGFTNPNEPKFFEYAIPQYEELLKLQPKQKEAIMGLADVYNQKQDYEKAEKLYKRLIALEPKNPEYQVKLGFNYLVQGMIDKAQEKATMALQYAPHYKRAYILQANIYEREQDPSAAILEYKKALASLGSQRPKEMSPQDAYIYLGLGRLFFKYGLYFDAVQQFEKVTQLWPKYAEGYLDLANFYYQVNLTDKAISTLNSLLSFNKSDVRAYSLLALTYYKKRDAEASYAYFKKAQALGAQVPEDFMENLNKLIQENKKPQDKDKKDEKNK